MVPNGGATARGRSSSEVADRSSSSIFPGRIENPTQIRCGSDSRPMQIQECFGGDFASSPSDAYSSRGRCPIILEEQPRDQNRHGWSAGRRDGRNPRKKRIPVCWDSRVSSSHLVSARTARTAEPAVEESGVLGQLSDSSSSAMASVRGQRSGKISARTSMNRASATVERRIVRRVMGPGASFGVQVSVCFQATGRGPLAGLLAGRLSGSQGRSAEESPAVGGNQVVRFPRARFSSISSSE